jgi:hypothetical protein
VLGITSDFRAGIDVDRLEAKIDVAGAASTQTFQLGADKGKVTFPLELPFDSVADGSRIAVTLQGYQLPATFIVERKAATQVVAGQKLLYRVHLEGSCRFSVAGSLGIMPCASGTCINGLCQDPFVPPAKLEPYDPNWPNAIGDICKPVGAGPPEVIVGEGQSDYKPNKDYDVAQVEAGPQGGYHVWVALRTKNLRRSGSVTSVSGEIPELSKTIEPLKVIFTLLPDEGGYCKLYGLRFQLVLGSLDVVKPMLGKKLKITGTVTDKDGAVGKGERWVTLSNDAK